jgi:hypothetical protein
VRIGDTVTVVAGPAFVPGSPIVPIVGTVEAIQYTSGQTVEFHGYLIEFLGELEAELVFVSLEPGGKLWAFRPTELSACAERRQVVYK